MCQGGLGGAVWVLGVAILLSHHAYCKNWTDSHQDHIQVNYDSEVKTEGVARYGRDSVQMPLI